MTAHKIGLKALGSVMALAALTTLSGCVVEARTMPARGYYREPTRTVYVEPTRPVYVEPARSVYVRRYY